ncbi:MAG: Rne/Rng family ribonuclease [Candidatus Ratteibacteria bacterium]
MRGKYRIFINNEKVLLRIIIEKNRRIENFFVYKPDFGPEIGNIYKGRVEKILPSINAAFVNIGESKSGFLQFDKQEFYYYDEYTKNLFYSRTYRPDEEILVQICKPQEGEKSPKVTEEIMIPGRYFVLIPNAKIQKISRKIKNRKERERLIKIFKKNIGQNIGFIIRTAAKVEKEDYIYREIKYLLNVWKKIKRDFKKNKAPFLLWRELPLYLKVLRDYANENFFSIEIDDEFIYNEVLKYVNLFIPELKGKIYLYKSRVPMFINYGFEEEIENFISKKVFLPSGGYLIIEKGETLTAIDVNSGKIEGENFEEVILKTNLEAADEIPRQIRCRNIGGVIIVDFVDMKNEYKKKVFKRFIKNLKEDKSKLNVLFISKLGLVEMCREKNDYSIYSLLLRECEDCNGSGILKDNGLIFFDLRKKIFEYFKNNPYNKIEILLSPLLYEFIFKNQLFKNFLFSDRIRIKLSPEFGRDEFKIIEMG